MATVEELLSRDLPKWPMMRVTGLPVGAEQAREVIRRTDQLFVTGYGGNDEAYVLRIKRAVGMPLSAFDVRSVADDWESRRVRERWQREVRWRKAWGCIPTEYVHNAWIACAFVYGPHGWMHPDGQIGFIDNVGKWPAATDVYADWRALAAAFPFVTAGVTLFDGEASEERTLHPVVSFRVAGGAVEVVDPEAADVHAGHPAPTRSPDGPATLEDAVLRLLLSPERRETAIPWSWIARWGEEHRERCTTAADATGGEE